MKNTEIFLEKFKQLEEIVRITYKLKDDDSISYYLTKQDKYKRFKEEIKYCQDVRNLLSHKKKLNNSFAVEPNPEMINFIDNLIEKIKNRPKCKDVYIDMKKIFWQPINGKVKNAMRVMKENKFTHTPILNEEGIVIGVFDENSIFNYLSDEEAIAIDDSLTFKDIEQYISLHNREMEDFLFFKSVSYVEDLETAIETAFKRNMRIGMAFITINGRENEKLQGIITPWDLLGQRK